MLEIEFTAQEFAVMAQLINEVVASDKKADSCYLLKNKCMQKAQAMMQAEQATAAEAKKKAEKPRKENRADKAKARKTAKKAAAK